MLEKMSEQNRLMDVAERLKYIRENILKMNQTDFAQKLNVSQKSVSRWEQGSNEPQLSAIKPLLEEYNLNINWILTGKGEMFVSFENGNSTLKGNVKIIKVKKGEQYLIDTE